jgi:DNA-binding IclR family transcriptional regulator
VRHGADSVCIARYLGSHPIQVPSIQVGARRPMGASASGIVLLAGMEEEQAAALTRANEKRLEGLGRSRRSVLAEVAAARRNGYAYARDGVMNGTSAPAVPVADASGQAAAAISIATLADRLRRERERSLVEAMRSSVERVTSRLLEIEKARTPANRR